jgi:hypothetical protein
MAATEKLSVSLGAEQAKWVRSRAKRRKKSVSAIVTEALATVAEPEARREFSGQAQPGRARDRR